MVRSILQDRNYGIKLALLGYRILWNVIEWLDKLRRVAGHERT